MVKNNLAMNAIGLDPARELASYKYALDRSAIVAITDRAGRIIHVNQKFCDISGYTRGELIGKTHKIVNSDFHSKSFFENMWHTIISGRVWQGEIRNKSKNGECYWVYTTIVPFLDDEGKPYQFMAIRFEITDRKLAEERIENLFNASLEGIIVHEEGGRILEANQSAAHIFGYSLGEMIDSNLSRFLGPGYKSQLASTNPAGNLDLHETHGYKRDGTEVSIVVGERPYNYQGHAVRLTIIRDITARKQMESQIMMQDRLASVGLLASSLAHEIGTPLGVIRGRAEFLGAQLGSNKAAQENLEVIVAQIDRVSALIRSLLNLARHDTSSKLGTGLVNQVVSDVLNLMAHGFRKNSITIRNEISADLAVRVGAEAEPLHQVFLNLIVNASQAIEAACKEQGRIEGHFVRIWAEDEGANWAIHVQDSGCGISEKNMRNLFKPFFTTKDVGVGTGLGLVTSYRIVERWNGKIGVKSKLAQGSIFTVVLPKA